MLLALRYGLVVIGWSQLGFVIRHAYTMTSLPNLAQLATPVAVNRAPPTSDGTEISSDRAHHSHLRRPNQSPRDTQLGTLSPC